MKGRQDEFRELSDAFDAMLGQLQSHVAEHQRFAANASHELRTPLAISRTLLDIARRGPVRDHDELLERLQAVNTRAIDLTEALLLLSRSDRGTFTRESVDLSLVAEEAAETLLRFAEQRRITLDVTGEAAPTSGSAELLLRMVTNLVQNAIVHNLPTGGTVTVHTEARGDTSVLRVENTGHRVPPELVPTLTEPFQRGTERVRTDEHAGCRPRPGHRAQHRPRPRRDPRLRPPPRRRSPRHGPAPRHAVSVESGSMPGRCRGRLNSASGALSSASCALSRSRHWSWERPPGSCRAAGRGPEGRQCGGVPGVGRPLSHCSRT